MLGHQGVILFEGIRRCGLVGERLSLELDFGVSEVQARSGGCLSSSFLQIWVWNSQILLQYHVCPCVVMLRMD